MRSYSRNTSDPKALGGHGAQASMKNKNTNNENTQAIMCLADESTIGIHLQQGASPFCLLFSILKRHHPLYVLFLIIT